MTWPFLYFADDRLSLPELMAARLDGDLIEIGDAFMPTDAVETRELRAGSLRGILGTHLAATHESAAWVHGAIHDPPSRHRTQRCVQKRVSPVLDSRLGYSDMRLPTRDALRVAGVTVTSVPRTLVDLVRDHVRTGEGIEVIQAFVEWDPTAVRSAIAWFDDAGPVHLKRPAIDHLRGLLVTTR